MKLKCSKCENIFELDLSAGVLLGSIHVGPYHLLKCPACARRSFFNMYSPAKAPITWPPQEKRVRSQIAATEEELERKRIEDSKYEKNDQ
jgi:hypothetical protein